MWAIDQVLYRLYRGLAVCLQCRLARSGSQSQRKIRFFLPAHDTVMKLAI